MRRSPTASIVVDANILLSAILGRRTRRTFFEVTAQRQLVTTDRVVEEVQKVATDLSPRLPTAQDRSSQILALIDVRSIGTYVDAMPSAEIVLRNAVASRNGSERDAHVLSLAWALDADIWSHDRDFAGTGWPSWSSANLLAALVASGEVG